MKHFLVLLTMMVNITLVTCDTRTRDKPKLKEELSRKHYDPERRPNHQGITDNVTIQLTIYSVGPIDEEFFTFKHGSVMRQWWTDERLISNNSSFLEATSLEGTIWIPDTSVQEAIKIETFSNAVRTEMNRTTGKVYLSKRLIATTRCEMDLVYYPMDYQTCKIVLETYAFSTKDIELFWHETPIITQDMALDGYDLEKIDTHEEMINYLVGNDHQIFKQLSVHVTVKRTFQYHVFRAYVPSILLIIISFGTFWVPDGAVPARVGMIITSFLANTFILQGVTEKTVKVPYTTPMQLFLLVNVVVIVTTMIEYLIVLQLRRMIELRKKRKCYRRSLRERKASLGDEVIYLNGKNGTDGTNGTNGVDRHNKSTEKLHNPKQSVQKPSHTMHILDRICQIAFPLAYGIFCAVYFGHYLSASVPSEI